MNKIKIVTASGQVNMDELVKQFDEYDVISTIEYREDLIKECQKHEPNILIVGDLLGGKKPLIPILIQLKNILPDIRIVYFTGTLDMNDDVRINMLGTLCSLGIYDIIQESIVSPQMIQHIISTPKVKESVQYITSRVKDSGSNKRKRPIEISIPDDLSGDDAQSYRNLYMFSSPKSGTGKSFLVSNIAVAIANMGVNNVSGKKPRVAIIDTDITGFTIGNIFKLQDDNKNIINALLAIKTIMNNKGELDASDSDIKKVQETIKLSFKTHPKYRNVDILTGVERSYKEEDSNVMSANALAFLIESIVDSYDVVIVDTNSDIEYEDIFPLLLISREIYFVMNMDYNTFKNDSRYKDYLKQFGVAHKIRHVLNQYIDDESLLFNKNKMEDIGYEFISKIPEIDKVKFLNMMYEGQSLIMSNNRETLYIRYEILKLAHNLWPIKNFNKISEQMEKLIEDPKEVEKEPSIFSQIANFLNKQKEKSQIKKEAKKREKLNKEETENLERNNQEEKVENSGISKIETEVEVEVKTEEEEIE